MDVLVTWAHGTAGTAITDVLGDDDRRDFTLLDVEVGSRGDRTKHVRPGFPASFAAAVVPVASN